MRPVFRASVLASVLVAATAANAADLPRRGAPSYDYAPPPVFVWSGLYFGLNVGAALGSFQGGAYQLFGSNPTGVLGGAQVGYNYQIAPNLVIGGEADFNGSSVSSSNTLPFFGFNGAAQMTALFTARGRIGYTMDRAMFYLTGGLAVASLHAQINDFRAIPFWGAGSAWQAGWTLGGGMEYALTNNVSAKVEYLYTSIGSNDYFTNSPVPTRLGIDFSTVRAGVNYHF